MHRSLVRVPILLVAVAVVPTLPAQPRMVTDLNRTPGWPPGSSPREFTATPSSTYFVATTAAVGAELWRWDAQGGIRLAADIAAGTTSSSPTAIVPFAGGVLCAAEDGEWGREVWRLEATGLARRFDIRPGYLSADPRELVVAGSSVFFTAEDGVHGRELWVTDGTGAGTRLVLDIWPGGDTSSPRRLVPHGAGVAFLARDPTHGTELWVSDGTAGGTRVARDILPGPPDGVADVQPVVAGGRVFFVGNDGVAGGEPWTSDATGTRLLFDCNPGSGSSNPYDMAALSDGRVVFGAFDVVHDIEPWVSDGTAAGTQVLVDLVPGVVGSYARMFRPTSDGRCFFYAQTPALGGELYITDGSAAGTHVIELTGGLWGTYIQGLMVSGNRAYFQAGMYRELSASDGTAPGTVVLVPRSVGVNPNTPIAPIANGGVMFAASDTATGEEPWVSDGTATGTRLLIDINRFATTMGSSATVVGEIGGRAVFFATDGTFVGLWASDGSAAGTQPLAPFMPHYRYPIRVARLRSTLLVFGADMVMRTDGTAAGTRLVANLTLPTLAVGLLDHDRAVFSVTDATNTRSQLWISDGTPVGTSLLRDNTLGSDFVSGRGVVYFAADDTAGGVGLWRTDGTVLGTSLIRSFGRYSLALDLLGMLGDALLLAGDTGARALWISDGTPAGTRLLSPVVPLYPTLSSSAAAAVGGRLVVAVRDGVVATDGTAGGTVRLLSVGGAHIPSIQVTALDRRALILVSQWSTTAMYVTDGTPAGTEYVPYPLPGTPPARSIPVGSDTVVFPFENAPGHHDFLLTDGTAANTRLLGAIPALGALHELTAVAADGLLFFPSYDGIHLDELWCTELGATAEAEGYGCGGSEVVLVASEPWLDRDWRCRASTSLPLAALVLGAAAWPPLPVGWPNCFAYVDLMQPTVVASFPAGSQTISLRLPASLELVGLRLGAQAVAGPAPPFGVALSNGLRLTLN